MTENKELKVDLLADSIGEEVKADCFREFGRLAEDIHTGKLDGELARLFASGNVYDKTEAWKEILFPPRHTIAPRGKGRRGKGDQK